MAGDAGGELTPWLLSIGGGVVTTLLAVVGKLWSKLEAERATHAAELASVRGELAEANDLVVKLQREGQDRSEGHTREHLRDLRRLAGLSSGTSGPWPAVITPAQQREVVIREAIEREPPPPRKPR